MHTLIKIAAGKRHMIAGTKKIFRFEFRIHSAKDLSWRLEHGDRSTE